jgi:predicted Fe-Mo cluster-binding NifX family protein
MKVVITSKGPTLEDAVDPRFGRCGAFLLAETESSEVRPVSNQAAMEGSGAGVQAAKKVVELGAQAVVTGQVGPRSLHVLRAANIPIYTGAAGTAHDALEAFKEGRLKRFEEESVPTGGTGRTTT